MFPSRTSRRRDYDACVRCAGRSLLQEENLARCRFHHGHFQLSRDIRRFRQVVHQQHGRHVVARNEYHGISNGLGGRTDLSSVDDSSINQFPRSPSRFDRNKVNADRVTDFERALFSLASGTL